MSQQEVSTPITHESTMADRFGRAVKDGGVAALAVLAFAAGSAKPHSAEAASLAETRVQHTGAEVYKETAARLDALLPRVRVKAEHSDMSWVGVADGEPEAATAYVSSEIAVDGTTTELTIFDEDPNDNKAPYKSVIYFGITGEYVGKSNYATKLTLLRKPNSIVVKTQGPGKKTYSSTVKRSNKKVPIGQGIVPLGFVSEAERIIGPVPIDTN